MLSQEPNHSLNVYYLQYASANPKAHRKQHPGDPTLIAPSAIARPAKTMTAGLAAPAGSAPAVLLLVFANARASKPPWPLDVASTAASTVAVFPVFVTAVVANVCGLCGVATSSALSLRKTRANAGAGTVIWQVLAVVSQATVWISRAPERRPSDSKLPPRDYVDSEFQSAVIVGIR